MNGEGVNWKANTVRPSVGQIWKAMYGKTVKLKSYSSWGENPVGRGKRKELIIIKGSNKDKVQEQVKWLRKGYPTGILG